MVDVTTPSLCTGVELALTSAPASSANRAPKLNLRSVGNIISPGQAASEKYREPSNRQQTKIITQMRPGRRAKVFEFAYIQGRDRGGIYGVGGAEDADRLTGDPCRIHVDSRTGEERGRDLQSVFNWDQRGSL
ncbi:hypothetical protein TESG_08650 [Trichophyton tonsurans CBS 112818]|uniref:Uncharacterized protein n=1 Tax=Trichophyton tonsurans (strain CBS 112818) TaxID=647933 RepID=F2SA76_TRIT1|nr:hypothetical protein TESG_08650 [Trichophyton tonsurans CBS 112818]